MITNHSQVAILLSTYNGERFLPELLDSLLRQTFKDFSVFVRDDGSTDSSRSIIDEYKKRDDRIVYINDDLHLGPAQTFLHLLNEIDSSYYMFCDQDDVWLENKIEISVKKIKEIEKETPGVPVYVYTDLVVTDGNLNIISQSMWEYSHLNVNLPTTFNYICVYNNIAGCTSILNNCTKNVVCQTPVSLPNNIYHDWWVAICVSKNRGKIVPLKKSTILFRRHGNNETVVSSESRSLSAKFKRMFQSYEVLRRRYVFFGSIGYGSFLKYLFYKGIIAIKYNK